MIIIIYYYHHTYTNNNTNSNSNNNCSFALPDLVLTGGIGKGSGERCDSETSRGIKPRQLRPISLLRLITPTKT